MIKINSKIILAITTTLILMGCGQDPPPKVLSSPTSAPGSPKVDSDGKPALPVTDAPADLSYTNRQLIEVNKNLPFNEGEILLQPIKAPNITSVAARIIKKVNTDKLSIETLNGNFLALASLDSGNFFSLTKASIKPNSKPSYYNIALTITPNAPTTFNDFFVGAHIISSAGAKGLIVAIDGSVIYIRFLTPTVNSPSPSLVLENLIKPFSDLDTIDYVDAKRLSAKINEVEASHLELTIANGANFNAGYDITSDSLNSGYIYARNNNVIKVDEINRTTGALGLRTNQYVSNNVIFSDPNKQIISKVSHDNHIVIERGVYRIIYATVSKGSGITFSISPSLPVGLSIDSSTGTISGIAEYMTSRELYVVTATNTLGSAYYAFNLEVRDYFNFSDTTGSKSFFTHKSGDSKPYRQCRINAADILEGNLGNLDIGCNLEAEELELFENKLKMTASVGSGVCEYIDFKPYSFWQYPPDKTPTTPAKMTVNYTSACSYNPVRAGYVDKVPTAEDCDGNYLSKGGPNCDDGQIVVVTHSASDPLTGVCDTTSTSFVQCGGNKFNCLSGPIRSVLPDSEIQAGYSSRVIYAYSGISKVWELQSPFENADSTNLRNANGLVNNSCTDSLADTKLWKDAHTYTKPTSTPFGSASPFYEFSCLDAAKDVKARIIVKVREWNRAFKITDIYDLTALSPKIPKKMNDNSSPMFETSYNNYFDWDDNYSLGGAANLPTCGIIGLCSAGNFTNELDCKANGETWSSLNNYQHPRGFL